MTMKLWILISLNSPSSVAMAIQYSENDWKPTDNVHWKVPPKHSTEYIEWERQGGNKPLRYRTVYQMAIKP